MAASTSTTFDPVIRELWPQRRINNLILQDRPFFARMRKKTDFHEKKRHISLRYNAGQGASESFAEAKANASSSNYEDFELTIASEHYYGTIDGLLLERSQSDKAMLVQAFDEETEGSLTTLADILNHDLFSDGSGSLGTANVANAAGTTEAVTTLTLDSVDDVVNIHRNMKLWFATNATTTVMGGGTPVEGKVSKVDRDNGKITLTAAVTLTGLATTTDTVHVFRAGDAQNGAADPSRLVGLGGWLPASAPTTTSFFGADRSVDPTKLGGVRYDGSSDGSIEEALIKAAQRMKREGSGARPNAIYLNPTDMGSLIIELGNRLERGPASQVEGADIGFTAILLRTPAGTMEVFQDVECPKGTSYMLREDTWTLHSLDSAPRPWSLDGRDTLRLSDGDAIEHRSIFRAQLGCDAPGWNCRVTLPS